MTSKYAIRAVAFLVAENSEGRTDSTQISAAAGIPRGFLLKILHALKMKGYLSSARGIGGGFRLSKPAEAINLFEIAELFEDLSRFSICPFGTDECLEANHCPLHEGWSRASAQFIDFLKTTTFARFKDEGFKDCLAKPGSAD